MGGNYKVVFSARSRQDLKELVTYVRHTSGDPAVAEHFGTGLLKKALTLSNLPQRGRVVPELEISDVREIIFKSYRIVYRIMPDQVQILRFWHAARGTPDINVDQFDS